MSCWIPSPPTAAIIAAVSCVVFVVIWVQVARAFFGGGLLLPQFLAPRTPRIQSLSPIIMRYSFRVICAKTWPPAPDRSQRGAIMNSAPSSKVNAMHQLLIKTN